MKPDREDEIEVVQSRSVEPMFFRAPAPPSRTPKEYQLAGVEYAIQRRHCLIGDAPGLGKTAEAILLSNAEEHKKVLVVCPASLRLNWEREIWAWSMIENVQTYPVLKSADGVSHEANYVIVSYDLLRNPSILGALLADRWDHLVLDEAHYLKDPKGNARTVPICAPDCLPRVVGRITMLSGTIMPNQPIECYNAVRLLNWDAIDRMSVDEFRNTYYAEGGGMVRGPVLVTHDEDGNPFKGGPHWESRLHWSTTVRNVPVNLDDLQYRLRKNLMVRRLKEQCLHELPAKQWHPFPLALTPDMRRALKHPGWREAEKLYEMNPNAFDRGVPVDGAISTARRLLGEAKAPAVVEYVEELIDSGVTKLVIGAWHHSVLDFLREKLNKHGVAYMDGATSTTKKQNEVDRFQNDERVVIMLGQMLSLGEGWTLTKAQDVILPEPFWVPGKNDQLFDRIHRLGQTGFCLGHVPVVPGTLDERILGTAIEKDQHIHKALDARV